MKIVMHPNEILRRSSRALDLEEIKKTDFKKIVTEMTELMWAKDGAGLSAPQVALNIRLIIVNDNNQAKVMINPKITKKSWAKEIEIEGCLSVANEKGELFYLPVARHKKIKVNYINLEGKKESLEAKNLLARIIQHEVDHLNGILFIDRAEKTKETKERKND